MKILECLGDAQSFLSAAEVARRTGLHRATAHRLLNILVDLGYVHKNPDDGTYTTGFYLHTFGYTPNVIASVSRHAGPFLRRLAHEARQNVSLGALEGIQMIYCERIQVATDVGIDVRPRMRLDAHATALGKALLSVRDIEDVRGVYEHHRLSVHTARTLKTIPSLLRDLTGVRERGFAIERDEYAVGRSAVAAAVINPYHRATCAISIEGPSAKFGDKQLAALGLKVVQAARALADRITRSDAGKPLSQRGL